MNRNYSPSDSNKTDDNFKWSFDISNIHKKNDQLFVFVAISRINVNEDMKYEDDNKKPNYKREKLKKKYLPLYDKHESQNVHDIVKIPLESKNNDESKKGIAIYRIELKSQKGENENEKNEEEKTYSLEAVTYYYSYNISGICKFIENSSEDNVNEDIKLRRFIILNYHGIHNLEFSDHYDSFEFGEKFEYPESLKCKFDITYCSNMERIERLLSCIYDKYFLVALYKKDIESFEGKLFL
jgi:hypothetical protein